MRGPSFDDTPPNISEELKKKFKEALKGRLENRTCQDCPGARGFVQVVEFLIDNHIEAIMRIDKAAQIMEDFIQVFKQLEEKDFMKRFEEIAEDGR